MKYQNFVGKIGFGSKGYSLLLNNKKMNAVFLSGINADYSVIYNKLRKIFDREVSWIKIKNRNNLNEIEKISKKLVNEKVNLIVVSGGGSVIDFSKNIVHSMKSILKKKVFFYVIPSRVGSGAEASISSILNLKNKKQITVNEGFLPDGIVYDLKFIQKLSKTDLISGSVDALTHCLESLSSINKNEYLDFFSINSIDHFVKKVNVSKLIKNRIVDEKILKEFCILSFNGGTAQNNAGSGLCHALAHSAEKIAGLPHTTCVSYFILPVIAYSLKTDKKYLSDLSKKLKKHISKKIKFLKNRLNFKKIELITHDNNKLELLINHAKKDPCWKIFNKNVRVDILKNSIKNFKI